jgi:DNA mismatch repair protein MutS2
MLEKEVEEKDLRIREKELALRRKENELKKGHQQEMHDFLIHSRRTLENLVRQLREGELTRDKTVGVKQFISDLEKDVERLDSKIEVEEEKLAVQEENFAKEAEAKRKQNGSSKKTKRKLSNAEALKYATPVMEAAGNGTSKRSVDDERPLVFEPGAAVTAGATHNEGVLIDLVRKGVWNVQFGSVKMTVKEKDLKLVRSSGVNNTPDVSYDLQATTSDERPVFELRLLGMRAEEAVKTLEHQIDLCALNNFPHFSVIHGKGDGILQQAVNDYLSHCPVVSSFEFAPPEDGGTGKTYVTLK